MLVLDRAATGIMETDWAENCASCCRGCAAPSAACSIRCTPPASATSSAPAWNAPPPGPEGLHQPPWRRGGLQQPAEGPDGLAAARRPTRSWKRPPVAPDAEARRGPRKRQTAVANKSSVAPTSCAHGRRPVVAAGRRQLRPRLAPCRPGVDRWRLHRRDRDRAQGLQFRAPCRPEGRRQVGEPGFFAKLFGKTDAAGGPLRYRACRSRRRRSQHGGGAQRPGRARRRARTASASSARCRRTEVRPAPCRCASAASAAAAAATRRWSRPATGGTSTASTDQASLREFETRLARAGLQPSELDAVFVTHEHGDHARLRARPGAPLHGLPLWDQPVALASAIGGATAHRTRTSRATASLVTIGALRLLPHTVPHDAG